jgi:hypothetical protein
VRARVALWEAAKPWLERLSNRLDPQRPFGIAGPEGRAGCALFSPEGHDSESATGITKPRWSGENAQTSPISLLRSSRWNVIFWRDDPETKLV